MRIHKATAISCRVMRLISSYLACREALRRRGRDWACCSNGDIELVSKNFAASEWDRGACGKLMATLRACGERSRHESSGERRRHRHSWNVELRNWANHTAASVVENMVSIHQDEKRKSFIHPSIDPYRALSDVCKFTVETRPTN